MTHDGNTASQSLGIISEQKWNIFEKWYGIWVSF